AADALERDNPLDLILIESGGDNLAATFSSELVEYWIFVIDCGAGDDIPRKRGLGMLQADLLVVNKIDIAPHVGADLDRIRRDVQVNRPQKATVYTNLRSPEGAAEVFAAIRRDAMFGRVGQ